MKKYVTVLVVLLALSAVPVSALQVELGAVAGGGLDFMFGSYLDAKAANLAEQGTVGTLPGTTQYNLFPGLSAGLYAETVLWRWLDLRVELRGSYLGASRLALRGDGTPFDAYGVGFYAVVLPVMARGVFALGPGSFVVDLGPFYGLVVGGVHIEDILATTTITTQMPLAFGQASMFGLSGGLGYQLPLGPGTLSVVLQADWTIFPAKLDTGLGSGDLQPLNVMIVLGYGFKVGRSN